MVNDEHISRVARKVELNARCSGISVVVSKRDGAFLKEVAADEHLTMRDLARLALDEFLQARGLPLLDPVHVERLS